MNILIIDRFPIVFLEQLGRLPVHVHYLPQTDREEVLKLIPRVDVLILNSKVRVDRELIDRAESLKLVCRAGVGMDHIDEGYLHQKGIAVKNTAGANADAVGEHTVGMLLALRHKLITSNAQVKQFQWLREQNRGLEIRGKKIGIVGYGNTGKAVGRNLSGFGSALLVYDKYVSDFGHDFIEEVEMERIFAEVEVLTLHIPLTEETNGMVNDEYLAKFRQPIWFLNLSRGPIVDLAALLRAIQSGKVLGAALDVLPNEKLHTLSPEEKALYEQLFALENVILSPHIGGWSVESLQNINQRILGYVADLLKEKGSA